MIGYFRVNIKFYYDDSLIINKTSYVFEDNNIVSNKFNKTIKGNTFQELWDTVEKYHLGNLWNKGIFTKSRRISGITFRDIIENKTTIQEFVLELSYEDVTDTVSFSDLKYESVIKVLQFLKERGITDNNIINVLK